MAGSLSDYAELKILEHSVGKTSWTMPTSCYAALWTTAPNDASTGAAPSPGVEVSGGSYARVQTNTSWGTATLSGITNSVDIVFPTASASWGTIVAVSLMDAITTGNFLWWGTLTASKTVASGDVFKFLTGQLVLTLD
jgi:hypothetical protein